MRTNRTRIAEGAIRQSKYVPKQMNGPIINSFENAQELQNAAAEEIVDYLHGLSMATAQETELENIGLIIGYPRPIVPEGFNQENIFLIGNLPLEIDPEVGFANDEGTIGGQLASTEPSNSGLKIGLGTYRKMLQTIARVKRYGITLKNVDDIAAEFSGDYTISWDASGDIKIHYTNSIGYKNVWVLTQLFYRVCTAPQVTIESGGN